MEELIRLLDENLEYERHEMHENKIMIYVKSRRTEIECPLCGTTSKKVHSTYLRKFQDLPISGKKVTIVITNKKYFCNNTGCENKTFAETYEFLPYHGRRSDRLTEEIIKISAEVSTVTASEILRDGIADVGRSTISSLLKKKGTPEINKTMVEKICIDDYAFKKGQTYGTVMVDIEARKIVDILGSREGADVTEWLKTYPNIKVVSRDGSLTYASAIKNAHPEAAQVSDRFHILKNLTEAAKKHITQLVGPKVRIGKEPLNASETEVEEKNQTAGYNDMPKAPPLDLAQRQHVTNLKKKEAEIKRVQELAKQGYRTSAISQELGIAPATVKRYSNESFNPSNANYGTKQESKLKPYTGMIDEMLKKRQTFKEIEAAIRQDGYNGAASTIRMYATRERRLIKEANDEALKDTELIERKWLVKLLFKPLDEISQITEDQLNRTIIEYPVIGKIYDLVGSFKEIMFSKKVNDIESWSNEAKRLGLKEVNSFVNGISKDLDAVKNAFLLTYNNGLAEGFVNKIKLIKRIMFGRSSFTLLRNKILRRESNNCFN